MKQILTNKKYLMIFGIFGALVFVLTFLALFLNYRQGANVENPLSYTITSSPVSNTTDSTIINVKKLQRSEAFQFLTPAINNAYKFTDIAPCSSEITNENFMDLKLKYDSCKWGAEVTEKGGITKSVMGTLFSSFITFTRLDIQTVSPTNINQKVQVSIVVPIGSGFEGPTTCIADSSKIVQLNSDLYKIKLDVNDANEGVKEIELYKNTGSIVLKGNQNFDTFLDYYLEDNSPASYTAINRNDYIVCVPPGPGFIVKTYFTGSALEVANRIENFSQGVSESWGGIYFLPGNDSFKSEAEELLKGFTL